LPGLGLRRSTPRATIDREPNVNLAKLLATTALVVAVLPAQDDAKLKEAIAAANKAFDAGRYDEADRAFEEVAAAAMDNFEAMFLRARINYALGEYGRTTTYADAAIKLDPSNFDVHMLSGNAFFAAGDLARDDGSSSQSRVMGFYRNSADSFAKAAELKPADPTPLAYRGHALFWVGEDMLDKSAEAFEKALAIREEGGFFFGLARTLAAKAEAEDRLANDKKSDDLRAKAAATRAKAVATAKKGLSTRVLDPVDADALAKIVFASAEKSKNYVEAFEAYKAWTEAHPKDSGAFVWAGFAKARQGDEAGASEHYAKAWDVSGRKNAVAAYELGLSHVRRGEHEKSCEWFAAAIDARPEGWDATEGPIGQLLGVGNAFAEKGDFAKATALVEKWALVRAKDSWRVHNNLGLWYRDWADRLGRRGGEAKAKNEAALKHYAKAAELVVADPDASGNWKARVLNDYGVIFDYQMGDMERGLKEYRRALSFDPEWIDALENVGLCMNKLGKYEDAIPLFKKVLAQQPDRMVSRRGLDTATSKLKK
jgi:tetratricopeptide (TPR) repeat protein